MPNPRYALYFVLGTLVAFSPSPLLSQIAREGKDAYSNFDIRELEPAAPARSSLRARIKGVASSQAVNKAVSAMNAARDALAASVPALHLEMNRWGTAPEVI